MVVFVTFSTIVFTCDGSGLSQCVTVVCSIFVKVHSSVSGSDTRLRVSLDSLLEADKVGRWWIVGSSWSGAPMNNESSGKSSQFVGKVWVLLFKK